MGDVLSCVDRGPSGLAAADVAATNDDDDDGQLAAQWRSVNAVTRPRVSPGARLATQSRLRVLHGGLQRL